MPSNARLVVRLQTLSRRAAMVSIAVGVLVIVGWLFHIEVFKSVLPGLATMKFNTALGFAGAGIALFYLDRQPRIARVAAWFVALLGLLTMCEYFFGWHLGIDQLFVPDELAPVDPGRMSFVTAVNYLLIGSALRLMIYARNVRLAQILTIAAGLLSLLAVLGYVYGVEALYQVFWFSSVALHTALTFLVLCLGIFIAYPDRGYFRVFSFLSTGGYMARSLLPVVVVIPIIVGKLRWEGELQGLYDTRFGLALYNLSNIVILGAIIMRIAYTLDKADVERQTALAGLQQARDELELRVEERTNDLVTANQALEQEVAQRSQAEDRFRSLLESAPDAMVIADHKGEIVLINGQAESIFGYGRNELIGEPIEILIPTSLSGHHPSHRASYTADPHVRAMGAGLDLHALRKDGSQFPVEISLSPIETAEGILIASAIRDITERKQAEEGIARMAAIFKASDDAIIGTNMDGIIVSWNPGAERLYGYPVDEIVGKPISVLVPPDRQDEAETLIANASAGMRIPPYETVRMHKNGRRIDISLTVSLIEGSDGKGIGIASISHDITIRKRAEKALKANMEEEHKFQTYLKQLHEITIELTNIDTLDEFYKQAVQLGLERLGFERMGLLLYDQENSAALGTYGTDTHGNPVAEHHLRLDPTNLTGILMRSLHKEERFAMDEQAELFYNLKSVGTGWNAAAVLWDGTNSLGWLTADNGVRHEPVTTTALDTLSLYAMTLGTLLARKQIQVDLRESETRFRRAITHAPFPIMIHAEDGEVLHLSNTWLEMTGYTFDEISTIAKWRKRAYGEQHEMIEHLVDIVYNQTKPLKSGEFKVRTKTGEVLTWDFIAASLGSLPDGRRMVSSMAMDITERKRAEEALERNANLLRTVLDNLPVGVWITDASGNIVQGNPAGTEIWAGARYVGIENYGEYKGWWVETGELIQPEEWAVARAMTAGETSLNEEIEIECFDGTHKFIMNSAIPMRDSQQNITGAIAVNQDITEIKQAGIALQRTNDNLQQANVEIQRFAYIVSHDLRSPLINLKGFSGVLQTSVDQLIGMSGSILPALDETQQQTWHTATEEKIPTALRFINTAVDRMDGFTSAILKLSRLGRQQLTYETIAVKDIVDHILQSLAAQIEDQGIQIIVEELPEIEADRIVLDQVLGNIITNAIKYLDPERPGQVRIFAETSDQHTIFHVQDNGRGIAESDYDKIFAPFRRAGRPTVEGEGMGLAYVQALVKRQEGRIWFASTLGEGTTFSILIPNVRENQNDAT